MREQLFVSHEHKRLHGRTNKPRGVCIASGLHLQRVNLSLKETSIFMSFSTPQAKPECIYLVMSAFQSSSSYGVEG